jgi:hypothetical protein
VAARPPLWRSALLSLLAGAALSGLGTVPGMGLPGGLTLITAGPLILLIWGGTDAQMFPQDSAWPFAIFVTWCLGPLVPIAWLGTRALGMAGWRRGLAVAAILIGGGTLAAIGVYAWGIVPLRALP